MKKGILTKIGSYWLLTIINENGSTTEHRFPTKKAALESANQIRGLQIDKF